MAGKGRIKTRCKTDGGELKCERVLEHSDGSTTTLARRGARVDGQCNAITTFMEGEDKELGKLNEFMDNRLKIGCKVKNPPEDY